ncbi:hypothetical protein, partial [Enterobacter bugandensis]|uniref:hypothetical protein n=1 Tax=Enterobacter bugandensis TaxID=881260 RepID=UPI001952F2C7
SGYDARAPLSLDDPGFRYEDKLAIDPKGLRFGWLGDLGGHLPFEPGVLELCAGAGDVLAGLGAHVAPARVDFDPEKLWR